jgi:hypothetical protein
VNGEVCTFCSMCDDGYYYTVDCEILQPTLPVASVLEAFRTTLFSGG